MKKGTAQQHVYSSTLGKMQIPVPSIEIQKKCIELYESKELQIKEYEKRIELYKSDLNNLKNITNNVIIENISSNKNLHNVDEISDIKEPVKITTKQKATTSESDESNESEEPKPKKKATIKRNPKAVKKTVKKQLVAHKCI